MGKHWRYGFFMTMTSTASEVADKLPQDVRDALDDLYDQDRQNRWMFSYATACRRRKKTMLYLVLREAGYSTEGYV